MGTKAWWADRVVVTALLTAVFAFYVALRGVIPVLPELDPTIVSSIIAILAAIGIFGRATDETKPKLGLKTTRKG